MSSIRKEIQDMFDSLNGIVEHFNGSFSHIRGGVGINKGKLKIQELAKKRARKSRAREWKKRKAHSQALRELARKEYACQNSK